MGYFKNEWTEREVLDERELVRACNNPEHLLYNEMNAETPSSYTEGSRLKALMNERCSMVKARHILKERGHNSVNIKKKAPKDPVGYMDVLNEDWVSSLLKDYSGDKEEVFDLLNSNLRGIPDLLCLKDNQLSFVEVKTNGSQVKQHQREVKDILESKGYSVEVMLFKVAVECELKDM